MIDTVLEDDLFVEELMADYDLENGGRPRADSQNKPTARKMTKTEKWTTSLRPRSVQAGEPVDFVLMRPYAQ